MLQCTAAAAVAAAAAAAAAAVVCCRLLKSVSRKRQIITVRAARWLAQLVRNIMGRPVECFLFDL